MSSPPPTTRSFSSYLVSPAELHRALDKGSPPSTAASRVIPLCATWFMPNDARTGLDSFRRLRIPHARFFDLDAVVDRHADLPHMLPSPKTFAASMSELGIRREDTVVVYDSHEAGIFSAPRVGWTLRVFGHERVHVLDNFKLWVEQGLPTETGEFYSIECGQYPIPELDESRVASFEDVREVALGSLGGTGGQEDASSSPAGGDGAETAPQIIDARAHGRWTGRDPEPRKGLSSGHMPGSINVPFSDVLDPTTKALLPADRLRALFAKRGVDPARPVVASCGTGVTACVIEAALGAAGHKGAVRVYDGSWT
jgi:thiosulfate/3-mercaptopyruvate sulfurtransferase